MKTGFKFASGVAFLVLYATGALGAVTGIEGNDFAPGEILVKFNGEITLEYVDGTYLTGLPEIDAINEANNVSYIEQVTPLPYEWLDDPTGYFTWDKYLTAYEDHGLGKIYYVEFDEGKTTVASVVNRYETTGLVEYAEPNYFVYPCETIPDDEMYPGQWYLDDEHAGAIRANLGWDYETGDPSIRIAVLDSGISMPHPDLYDKIIWPRDCWELDDRPLDYDSHGTAVAGIAAAETNNDYEFDPPPHLALGMAGTSWNSRIEPIKITTERYNPYTGLWDLWHSDVLHINRGIDWAMTHHGRVINMSFGGYDESGSFHDHVEAAWEGGHLLIAAAGNDGISYPLFYPAAWEEVIAVSAIDREAIIVKKPKWSWASNYGSYIELCAPGVYMYTTDWPGDNGTPNDPYDDYEWDPEEHGGWPDGYEFYNKYRPGLQGYFGGTSGAAPVVSGVAALLWAQHPTWTNQQIRDWLNKTAWDLGAEGRDIYYGYGRVDAFNALRGNVFKETGGPGVLPGKDGKGVFALFQNTPNPVADTTVINFSVPDDCNAPAAELTIYDVTGRVIASFEEPLVGAGEYSITWDRTVHNAVIGSGVYLYKLTAGDYGAVRKMVVE